MTGSFAGSMMEKRGAFTALAIAVVIQSAWLILMTAEHHHVIFSTALFDVLFGALLITGGRFRWLAAVLRIAIGVNFGLAVADRFGLLGAYGSPGVSWAIGRISSSTRVRSTRSYRLV